MTASDSSAVLPANAPPTSHRYPAPPVANAAISASSRSRPSSCGIRWCRARPNSRSVARYAGSGRGGGGTGSRCKSPMPATPSRDHHAAGSATPGPQSGCAGSACSAVSGTAVIADGPSRGACSVTTPSRRPPATTGAPDIPDHCDSPSASARGGSARGATVTCTLSNPVVSFDSTGTTPIASTVSRTAVRVRDRVSANHGYPTAWQRSTGSPVALSRSTAASPIGGRSPRTPGRRSPAAPDPGPGRPHRRRTAGPPSRCTRACPGRAPSPTPRPATTCAAVSTVRPRTMHPDPYRYRGSAAVPRSAITSTTRAANAAAATGLPLTLAARLGDLHRVALTIHRPAEHDRHRLFRAALPAPPPPQLHVHDRHLKPRLAIHRPASPSPVSSTVIDSTGNWISDTAPAARAFSSSSRSNPIASASPRPGTDPSSRSDIQPPRTSPRLSSAPRGTSRANPRPVLRHYRSSRNSQACQ